jgi:glycosyltransferase involved in cell wall biosynthesis
LEALAAEGHEVTLLTFGQPDEVDRHYSALRQVCRQIEAVPLVMDRLCSTTDYLNRLLGLFSAKSYRAQRFASSAMRTRIHHCLGRDSYDAVLCDTVYSAVNLPPTRVPVILNCHDVEHVTLRRYAAVERNLVKRLYALSETYKLRKFEQDTCRRAATGMACSEHDRRLLHALCPELRVTVVPNVVDVDHYVPNGDGDVQTLLFQGTMDWFPNSDAVNFFVAQVLPALRRRVRGVRLVVAGRNPSQSFLERFRGVSEIEFTGAVEDMRSEIARAAVCVVPLRIGSGTRLKILEAAAMAKAIVSTRIGAEGLNFADGEEILLADGPRQFADAVADLLADPARRHAMGSAARRRVETQYSLPVLRVALRETLAFLTATSSTVSLMPQRSPASAEVRP